MSAETQHTATGGVLIGTVSYLAPELVVDGRSDARGDVYAAGVLIYELLTGRKPHEGESPIQVAYKHVHEDVPPPSAELPGIPPYVDALVARATARDRGLRPADARVLLHQVRRVRGALDHGVRDDPELTADLAPTVPVWRAEDDIDYVTEDDVPTILTPGQVARAAAVGGISSVGDVDRHAGAGEGPSVIGRLPADRPSPSPATRSPARMDRPAMPAKPRRSRRGPILLLVVLLLAVGAGAGAWWFGTGRYTTTPGVVNLTAAEARAEIQSAGLGYREGEPEYSETVEAGSVLSTDPAGGERILKDGTVTVTLSRGAERYQVPPLRGMALPEATAALEDTNLTVGDVTRRFNERVRRGLVLAADPAPGQQLRPDSAVDLVVSRGPRPIEVRDFTGKNADRALDYFDGKGVTVDVTEENSDTVPEGRVISQTPTEGDVFRGDTVQLTVSEGPVLVEIPDLTAQGVDAATQTLQGLGFVVQTQPGPGYLGLGFVSDADPGFGTKAPKGSTVTLFLV